MVMLLAAIILFIQFLISIAKKVATPILLSLVIASLIRLFFIFISTTQTNYDIASYTIIGEAMQKGESIYPLLSASHYPYLPLFLYFESFAVFLSHFGVSVSFFLKIFISCFDVGIVWLVYLLSNKNRNLAFLYAINPVTILISAWHGQFDAIPLFFVLLSVLFSVKKQKVASALSYAFSILWKPWPIILLLFFIRKNSLKTQVISIGILCSVCLLMYILLFPVPLMSVLTQIIGYRSVLGYWSLGSITPFLSGPPIFISTKLIRLSSVILFLIGLWSIKKAEQSKQIFLTFLIFFSVSFGFSVQYFAWIIPFLILNTIRSNRLIYSVIFFQVLITYSAWQLCANEICIPSFLPMIYRVVSIGTWIVFFILSGIQLRNQYYKTK